MDKNNQAKKMNILSDIHLISLIIGFIIWMVFWLLLYMWLYKNEIRKADVFAVGFSLFWIGAIFLKIETPYMLDIVWGASAVHIIWEKSITVFIELILKHKTWK